MPVHFKTSDLQNSKRKKLCFLSPQVGDKSLQWQQEISMIIYTYNILYVIHTYHRVQLLNVVDNQNKENQNKENFTLY